MTGYRRPHWHVTPAEGTRSYDLVSDEALIRFLKNRRGTVFVDRVEGDVTPAFVVSSINHYSEHGVYINGQYWRRVSTKKPWTCALSGEQIRSGELAFMPSSGAIVSDEGYRTERILPDAVLDWIRRRPSGRPRPVKGRKARR